MDVECVSKLVVWMVRNCEKNAEQPPSASKHGSLVGSQHGRLVGSQHGRLVGSQHRSLVSSYIGGALANLGRLIPSFHPLAANICAHTRTCTRAHTHLYTRA
jgi:hypothetical protein